MDFVSTKMGDFPASHVSSFGIIGKMCGFNKVEALPLNLGSLQSVRNTFESFQQKYGPLGLR